MASNNAESHDLVPAWLRKATQEKKHIWSFSEKSGEEVTASSRVSGNTNSNGFRRDEHRQSPLGPRSKFVFEPSSEGKRESQERRSPATRHHSLENGVQPAPERGNGTPFSFPRRQLGRTGSTDYRLLAEAPSNGTDSAVASFIGDSSEYRLLRRLNSDVHSTRVSDIDKDFPSLSADPKAPEKTPKPVLSGSAWGECRHCGRAGGFCLEKPYSKILSNGKEMFSLHEGKPHHCPLRATLADGSREMRKFSVAASVGGPPLSTKVKLIRRVNKDKNATRRGLLLKNGSAESPDHSARNSLAPSAGYCEQARLSEGLSPREGVSRASATLNGQRGHADSEKAAEGDERQEDAVPLSSSVEAERRLLMEMGWKDTEEEDYVITEDDKREFARLLREKSGPAKKGNVAPPLTAIAVAAPISLSPLLLDDDVPLSSSDSEDNE